MCNFMAFALRYVHCTIQDFWCWWFDWIWFDNTHFLCNDLFFCKGHAVSGEQVSEKGFHVVFVGKGLVKSQSYSWSALSGFTRDVVTFQESWRVMLISIAGDVWRVRMASFSQFCWKRWWLSLIWSWNFQLHIRLNHHLFQLGMCFQVLLFGWHTWCGRRRGGGGKSQSKMCLS